MQYTVRQRDADLLIGCKKDEFLDALYDIKGMHGVTLDYDKEKIKLD